MKRNLSLRLAAGYGGLALSIEGPSKVDIQTEDVEDGTCRVTYCPTEPGNYIVSIRFAEEHVPGPKTIAFIGQKNFSSQAADVSTPHKIRGSGVDFKLAACCRQQEVRSQCG